MYSESSMVSMMIALLSALLLCIYPVADSPTHVGLTAYSLYRYPWLPVISSLYRLPLQLSEMLGYRAFLIRNFQAGSTYFHVVTVRPFPSTRRVLWLLLTSCDSLLLAFRPRKISPSKNIHFPSIHPPSLHPLIRLAMGLRDNMDTYPQRSA